MDAGEATPFNAKPRITSGPDSASLAENTTGDLGEFTASDSTPSSGDIDWSLGGDDPGFFSTSVDADGDMTLSLATERDFEDPQNKDEDNRYKVKVFASDKGTPIATSSGHAFELTITDVNEQPATVSTNLIGNQEMTVGDPDLEISLTNRFSDPDGDTLSYSVSSSNTAAATAAIDGGNVDLTAVAAGTATITVTAADRGVGHPDRLSVSQAFTVTVKPPLGVSISDLGDRVKKGSTDDFTVKATGLETAFQYTVDVSVDNDNAAFGSSCPDRNDSKTLSAGSTSRSASFTLRGCELGQAAVKRS